MGCKSMGSGIFVQGAGMTEASKRPWAPGGIYELDQGIWASVIYDDDGVSSVDVSHSDRAECRKRRDTIIRAVNNFDEMKLCLKELLAVIPYIASGKTKYDFTGLQERTRAVLAKIEE